jgi:hypothetical protein
MMAISITAARITFWLAALFLVLLAVLHILKPEYDPSWRMVSEYEIGRFGWAMQLAFFSLATASVSAIAAVWSQAKSIIGYVGLNRTTRDWHRRTLVDRSIVARPIVQSTRFCCAESDDSGYSSS